MVTLGMDRRPTPGPSTHAIGSWKLILTSAQSIMSILTYSSLDAATKNNYLSIRGSSAGTQLDIQRQYA